MNTKHSILSAFLLNLGFSIFEFLGGIFTGSIAIASDALHDLTDAISIGASYLLEKKSYRPADARYTYGYGRYSVIGAAITTIILLIGSILIILHSISRLQSPPAIRSNGMIFMSFIGIVVNTCAVWFTRQGDSVNQKAVNLHMLEDMLGWIVVLIGSVVIRITGWTILDPIMSIGLALFILYHALGNIREIVDIILQKTPSGTDPNQIMADIIKIHGIIDAHHLHIWTLDGHRNVASVHIVSDENPHTVKNAVREMLTQYDIHHITIETERSGEECYNTGFYHTAHHPHPHRHHH